MVDKLLTLKDVAKYLQLSETTIYKMARVGEIPAIKIANQWRFKKEDIDKWFEKTEKRKNIKINEFKKIFSYKIF